jgi:haloalkane dehalogenase
MSVSEETRSPHRPAWLPRQEYPFESRFLELDANRIHYIDEGSGPLLLFVHAGPSWSFVFRGVVARLRGRFRCVSLDFPGSGLSSAAAGFEASLASASRVLEQFVRAVDLRNLTLVAHDIGGPVAIHAFSRLPDRLRGFAVTGSFAWPLREYPSIARMLRLVEGPVVGALDASTNLIARSTARFGLGDLSRTGRAAYRGPFRDRRVRRNARSMLGQAVRSDEFLAGVQARLSETVADLPALIVWGEKDPTRKQGWLSRWEQVLHHSRSHVVRGARHFPQMSAPEEVSALIEEWWKEEIAEA